MGTDSLTLKDLLEAFLESLRPQVHEVLVAHNLKILASYEAAFGIRIPRCREDVPDAWQSLFHPFQSATESALAIRTPLSVYCETSLIHAKLDAAGAVGGVVEQRLRDLEDMARRTHAAHLDVLVGLLRIFNHGAEPFTTLAAIKATGLYPGSTPPDFDVFDHM